MFPVQRWAFEIQRSLFFGVSSHTKGQRCPFLMRRWMFSHRNRGQSGFSIQGGTGGLELTYGYDAVGNLEYLDSDS